ncbi:diguanylate cyclase [Luteitalea sp.]|uniref:diguanylate cyclase n=1 Tax=Luteitalea sp. TaxID=2004800 RepID=UPI0025B9414F|nr:diguanylate cyclase [Luteitalea sp.]
MTRSLPPARLLLLAAVSAVGGALLLVGGQAVSGALLVGIGVGLGTAAALARPPVTRAEEPSAEYVHSSLVEALAGAIDAKHDPSGKRLQRRREWATALARAVGLPPADIDALRTAALLLDIGQLAVPDHILSKPGPLSVEEFHKIRIHPEVSAGLIEGVPLPKAVGAFVRSHHERWDGKGYPEGLAKDAIPVGARVLAVVDNYDALVSERPYRDRLTREAAIAVLREEEGKSLDPSIVERFITLLPSIEGGAGHESAVDSSLVSIVTARREDVALFEISQAISAGLGVEGTAQLLAQKLRRVIPYSSAALYLYDPERRSFKAAFTEGIEADVLATVHVSAEAGMFGQSLREQRAVANGDPHVCLDARAAATTRLRSSIVCPLYGERNELVGAMAIYHVTPGCYTQDECRMLEMVARQAGPVVSHALQLSRAQEEALTDPLTGLPNTRFLWMHLTQELARAARQASRLALLLVDVDDFKSVNDNEGHPIGDLALKELAAVLRQAVRPYDVCARYGGDEFVIMLPECGREEAEERLRDLQTKIARHDVRLPDGRTFTLGVSIGAAVFPRDGDSSEALLAAADARMYQDKHRWREQGDRDREHGSGDTFPNNLPRPPLHKM